LSLLPASRKTSSFSVQPTAEVGSRLDLHPAPLVLADGGRGVGSATEQRTEPATAALSDSGGERIGIAS
jgi:hypothetical protein